LFFHVACVVSLPVRDGLSALSKRLINPTFHFQVGDQVILYITCLLYHSITSRMYIYVNVPYCLNIEMGMYMLICILSHPF
jgi:hypothetical protein